MDASVHNPLKGYIERIQKDKEFEGYEILPFLVRTGEFSSHECNLIGEYKVFGREDFLQFFEQQGASVSCHVLLQDFVSYLNDLNLDFNRFNDKIVEEWGWNGWKGFLSYLLKETAFGSWQYVPNKTGGFLSARTPHVVFGSEGYILYWQIESDKRAICLKIGEVYKDFGAVRGRAIHLIDEFLKEKEIVGVKRPSHLGNGCYMTIKRIEAEDWLGSKDEPLDLEKVVERINGYLAMLQPMGEYVKQHWNI